jgi:hypothetical protein
MTDDEVRAHLAARIEARHLDLARFLREHRPRNRRRANVTLVLTSLAAVFTIGPAVGGESFSGGVQKALGLASDSYVWRTLCLCALLVSAGAAVMTNIGKSRDDTGQIASAEAAGLELEGLLTLLEFGTISTDDAAKLYQQYVGKVPFVEASAPAGRDVGGRSGGPLGPGPETRIAPLPPPPPRRGPARPTGPPVAGPR